MDFGCWLFVASASFLGCFFFVLGGLYLALRFAAPLFAVGLRENIEDLHRAKKGTPTMGGLVFGIALFLVMGMVFLYTRDTRLYALLGIWLIFMAIGLWDDLSKIYYKRGISSLQKWLSLCIGTVIALYIWRIHSGSSFPTSILIGTYALPVGGSIFFCWASFVILSMANCVNFTDGLDGLAAGTVSLYLLFFALCALVVGDVVMLLVFSALLGALLGFLWHNGHPARVFMGDVGALSLGGLLGLAVLMMRLELLIPIACVILVAEGGSVILQVLGWRLFGRRIFYLAPLHHHFEKRGIPESHIVNRFILLSVISTTCAGLVFMRFFLGSV